MHLRYKIWLETTGKAFGDGPLDILQRVERTGSLRKAAREINMSYSQAWWLIKTLEKRLGFKLLESKTGGKSGGRSYPTPRAKNLMQKYELFSKEAAEALEQVYEKHFGERME